VRSVTPFAAEFGRIEASNNKEAPAMVRLGTHVSMSFPWYIRVLRFFRGQLTFFSGRVVEVRPDGSYVAYCVAADESIEFAPR
jgi:hypothetical protein